MEKRVKNREYTFLLALEILGFEPKQLDCAAYQGQAFNCNAQYVACGNSGYTTLAIAGVFYCFCAAGVAISCGSLLAECYVANNASYPKCAKLAGRGEFWKDIQNPWLLPVELPYPPQILKIKIMKDKVLVGAIFVGLTIYIISAKVWIFAIIVTCIHSVNLYYNSKTGKRDISTLIILILAILLAITTFTMDL